MASFYADASALVKQHLNEKGTQWMRNLIDPAQGHDIVTARISMVEVVSALARAGRDGVITAAQSAIIDADFQQLCQFRYTWFELDSIIIVQAQQVLRRHPLRSFDAIHVATALIAHTSLANAGLPALTFLAADNRLLTVAQAEGLAIDNPNSYT
jgi:hypothetical protein